MTSKSSEHNKLIAAAAKKVLLPLGCVRVGQSRTWISDQGFWLIVIEFQPSGWEKGTYLNVGAMWLWQATKGFSFDYGDREDDFTPFETPAQYVSDVERKATRAAERVRELRRKLGSVEDVKRVLLEAIRGSSGGLYHAAVACGLSGEPDLARTFFERFETYAAPFTWGEKRVAESAILRRALVDQDVF